MHNAFVCPVAMGLVWQQHKLRNAPMALQRRVHALRLHRERACMHASMSRCAAAAPSPISLERGWQTAVASGSANSSRFSSPDLFVQHQDAEGGTAVAWPHHRQRTSSNRKLRHRAIEKCLSIYVTICFVASSQHYRVVGGEVAGRRRAPVLLSASPCTSRIGFLILSALLKGAMLAYTSGAFQKVRCSDWKPNGVSVRL